MQSPKIQGTAKGRSRNSPKPPPSSAAATVTGAVTDEPITELINEVEKIKISEKNKPRSFPNSVKQECWENAEKIKGRDPHRWRKDPFGNIVFHKFVGCPGALCYEYDHILPYSKGGMSTVDNCQVLQTTVNRSKGNRTDLSRADLIERSSFCRVSGRDMDLLELSSYGDVCRGQDSGGCRIL